MSETQVHSITVDALLISPRPGEFLRRFRQELASFSEVDRAQLEPAILSTVQQSAANSHPFSEIRNEQSLVESSDPKPQRTRFGPASYPGEYKKVYTGEDPLKPGLEDLAQFLATPKSERAFESIIAFAEHFGISRMTAHRWRKRDDVLRRAMRLSRNNKLAGELAARQRWERVVEAVADLAEGGDVAAAKLLKSIGWPEERDGDSVLANMTIDEALILSQRHVNPPSWMTRRNLTGRVVKLNSSDNKVGEGKTKDGADPEKKANET